MKRRLQLDYRLPTGRLAPHLEALAEGRALARRCSACGDLAFPPALTCATCGARAGTWQPLSGRATVLYRTDTPEAAYALARFDGAGRALVRLANPECTHDRGRLIAPPDTHAGLWLALEETEDDD